MIFPKKCKNNEPTNRHCWHLRLLFSISACNRAYLFFPLPMSHWKMMNIYCTFSKYRNTQVQSHKPKLLSHFIGRESRKGDRASDSYISINTYIQHITLITWHLQYIVIKDLSWRKNFFWRECFFSWFFFCHGRIIVIVSAFVLFIIINIIVLLVGWRLGLTHLCLWLVVLALLRTEEKKTLQLKMANEALIEFIQT